jgi:oligosaccharyltransferase complex subunit beta
MRIPFIGLILGLLSIVSALSAAGSKLLVVLEEEGERSKYSQFFNDLEGSPTLRLNKRN